MTFNPVPNFETHPLNQQFFECKPSKLPPSNFEWGGQPNYSKNLVYQSNYCSPNIKDKKIYYELCISQC